MFVWKSNVNNKKCRRRVAPFVPEFGPQFGLIAGAGRAKTVTVVAGAAVAARSVVLPPGPPHQGGRVVTARRLRGTAVNGCTTYNMVGVNKDSPCPKLFATFHQKPSLKSQCCCYLCYSLQIIIFITFLILIFLETYRMKAFSWGPYTSVWPPAVCNCPLLPLQLSCLCPDWNENIYFKIEPFLGKILLWISVCYFSFPSLTWYKIFQS